MSIFLFNLFKHRHSWSDEKQNPWGLATKQTCKCGIYREVIAKPDSRSIGSNFFWQHSDGSLEKDERAFKHN